MDVKSLFFLWEGGKKGSNTDYVWGWCFRGEPFFTTLIGRYEEQVTARHFCSQFLSMTIETGACGGFGDDVVNFKVFLFLEADWDHFFARRCIARRQYG